MASERVERRLTAIFAGDVAGYSRLMGADEEGTLARLNAHLRELLDPMIAEHRGRRVNRTGDGVLVEFSSAVDAVRCAVEIQRGMAERNADLAMNKRIEFRIGIHIGDIISEGDAIFGDGVNIAARLEGIAAPGGICISDDAYRYVRGKLNAVIEDGGERQLKNIARPVRVYRVRSNATTGAATPDVEASPMLHALALLWRSINERKMVQWTIGYVALAYSIQHGVVLTGEAFDWPQSVQRISMLLLALGMPVVMTLAWYHGDRGSQRVSGPELTIISILLVVGSLLFFIFIRPAGELVASTAASQQPGVAAARVASGTQANAISIAVLPFVNLSNDAEQEFFSDGMTEEITSALAKVQGLTVIGRTSAFEFKGQNKDLRAIGQALGTTHLIEGSVRKDGNRVRISAQLIQANNGAHVWNENYDRELTDIFAIQEDIATAIAGALRVPLGLAPGDTLVSNRTTDVDSYQQYLRARALVRARGLKPLSDAVSLLEQVVARDSNYAPAWALLALAHGLMPASSPAFGDGSVDEVRRLVDVSLRRAEAAAQRAIQLDAKSADGFISLGFAHQRRGKVLLAEELYSKALALDGSNPEGLHRYSDLLGDVGRLEEALAVRRRLQGVEPFVPVFNTQTAQFLWLHGEHDEAIAILKDIPQGGRNRTTKLAMIYSAMHRYSEAADALLETPPGVYSQEMVEAAVRLLRTVPGTNVAPQTLPRLGALGFLYLHVGAPERALDFYEGNVDEGYMGGNTTAALWHSSYDAVRKLERFKAFVRKAGFVDYWHAKGWPEFCHPTTGDDFVCV